MIPTPSSTPITSYFSQLFRMKSDDISMKKEEKKEEKEENEKRRKNNNFSKCNSTFIFNPSSSPCSEEEEVKESSNSISSFNCNSKPNPLSDPTPNSNPKSVPKPNSNNSTYYNSHLEDYERDLEEFEKKSMYPKKGWIKEDLEEFGEKNGTEDDGENKCTCELS